MRTLKILGFLLTYPTENHQKALTECRALLKQEKWLSEKTLQSLELLFQEIEAGDLLDLQESYVSLFDRTPSLSLHLFEHIHGDSRERGQALVDLTNVYEEAGLIIRMDETPDYLPLFLEYISILAADDTRENLGSVVNILSALGARLQNRESSYSAVFKSLVEVAGKNPDKKAVEAALNKSTGAPYSFEQVDEEWEEQFAFANTEQTTGQNSGCPKAEEMLTRMNEGYPKKEERTE